MLMVWEGREEVVHKYIPSDERKKSKSEMDDVFLIGIDTE